jgi:FkbM family methyltransferase
MTHYSSLDCKGEYFEDKLDKIFKQKYSGVFVELGAHNGLIQSNTAFFEFNRGWRGILIEPSTNQYEECKKNRPNSFVLNYACVSNEYQKDTIEGDFIGGMMSSVNAERTKRKCDLITIKATTLEKIFDEYNFKEIDFLSLDTEGYELNILKGINFSKI